MKLKIVKWRKIFLKILRERVHSSQTISWTKLETKKKGQKERRSTRHVDTINLRFYSHIRFYTTISYIEPPLRDPEAFSRLPAKKVRAWRKQGIKKGVAVLWRNFLCAFKTPRATSEGWGWCSDFPRVTLWTTKISFPTQSRYWMAHFYLTIFNNFIRIVIPLIRIEFVIKYRGEIYFCWDVRTYYC